MMAPFWITAHPIPARFAKHQPLHVALAMAFMELVVSIPMRVVYGYRAGAADSKGIVAVVAGLMGMLYRLVVSLMFVGILLPLTLIGMVRWGLRRRNPGA